MSEFTRVVGSVIDEYSVSGYGFSLEEAFLSLLHCVEIILSLYFFENQKL